MSQHGGQLIRVEQVKRARADHDRGAQPWHAVGGRGRVVDHQRAGNLGVIVRQQAEQRPLPVPGPEHGRRRGRRIHTSRASSAMPAASETSRSAAMRPNGPIGEPSTPACRSLGGQLGYLQPGGRSRARRSARRSRTRPARQRRPGPSPGRAPATARSPGPGSGAASSRRPAGMPLERSPSRTFRAELQQLAPHQLRSAPLSVSRAARSASASAPDTLRANLVSAACRSPVWSSAVSISSATYASRLSAGR